MENVWKILSKPDNVPIVGMLLSVVFFAAWAFVLAGLFFWTMVALPIKIAIRLAFDIKYVWVTPWFNI